MKVLFFLGSSTFEGNIGVVLANAKELRRQFNFKFLLYHALAFGFFQVGKMNSFGPFGIFIKSFSLRQDGYRYRAIDAII